LLPGDSECSEVQLGLKRKHEKAMDDAVAERDRCKQEGVEFMTTVRARVGNKAAKTAATSAGMCDAELDKVIEAAQRAKQHNATTRSELDVVVEAS
jgi:arabinogalactan endo-1,4-beta-galactosidase